MEEYRILTNDGYHHNNTSRNNIGCTKYNNEEFINEITTLDSCLDYVDKCLSNTAIYEDQKLNGSSRDCPNLAFMKNSVKETMALTLNLSQASLASCPTYTNIPFVQIHTTDVQPQKMSFGNVFRRSNSNNSNNNINKQEIKSEPIKSESADITIKERSNSTPTPPSRTEQLHSQNDILSECGILSGDVGQQQKQDQEQEKSSNQSNKSVLRDSDTCFGNQINIFKCTECPYICLNSLDLDLHMVKVHTGEMATKIDEQRLQLKCLGCLNVFYTLQCLELHYKMDHLMSSENIRQLIGTYITSALTPDDIQKSNRIFLKNVKQLCEPVATTINTTTTLSNHNGNSNNDNNNNNNKINFNELNNAIRKNDGNCREESKNVTTKQKISIKSVDVLREPALLQYNDFNRQYNQNINNTMNINNHSNNNNSRSDDTSSISTKNFLNGFLLPTTTNDINHFQMPFDNNHSKQLYHYNMNSLITTSIATVTTIAVTSAVVVPAEITTTTATTTMTTTSKRIESINNDHVVHNENLLASTTEMDANRIATPIKQPKIYVKSVESFNVTSMHNSAVLPTNTIMADTDNSYYAINENLLNVNVNNDLYENVDVDDNGNDGGNGSNFLHLPFSYDPDDVSGDGGCENNLSINANFMNLESPLSTLQLLNNFSNNDSINNNNSNNNNNNDNEITNTNNTNSSSNSNYILEASLLNGNSFDCNGINAYAISTQSQAINLPVTDQLSSTEYDVAKVELNAKKLSPQFSFCQETRGTLHLRTVDELNLMNENEVQDLIAPNLENNNNNYNSNNNSSNHQHNNDELINMNNDDGMVITTAIITVTTTSTPITSTATSIISNNSATHLTTNSFDAINILQDTFYADDSFKFHDLDTQMVNNWSDNYDELAQDINYIIDHNTATASTTVTAFTTATGTATAPVNTNATRTVLSSIENDTIDRLNDKHTHNDDSDIDARLNTLISIRDIDDLTEAVLSDDTITATAVTTSCTTMKTLTTSTLPTIANMHNEKLKEYKQYQHQQPHHPLPQQQQQALPQSTLPFFNDCNSQIELNLSSHNNNKGNNVGHFGTVIHDKEGVNVTTNAATSIIMLNGSKAKLNQSMLRITKDNNNDNEKNIDDVPPLVPVSKSIFHVNGLEERRPQKNSNENVIEIIKRLPVPPLIKFCNNKQQTKLPSSVPLPNAPIEKGRIYVANNLMEQPKQQNANVTVKTNGSSTAISGTSIRGRPYGGNRSCDIKNVQGTNAKVQIKNNNLKCTVKGCTFRFKKSETLEYHKKCHYLNNHNNQHQHDSSTSEVNEKHKIMCPECKTLKFNNWNTLHTHLWRQHQIDMELYKCDLCNFKTPIYSRLINTHTKIHLDERNYKCEECSKAFKNAKQLKNHRRWHRMQLIINKSRNDNHNDKHDNEMESKKNSSKLQDVTTVSSMRIYSCSKCGVAYSQLKSLREHYCKIPVEAGGVQLKCDVCEKLMSTKASLRLHRLTQHNSGGGDTNNGDCSSKEKRFKCQLCVYTTNDHNAMRRHNMCHEKKAMYQCQYCDYKSVQSAAYQKHIRQKHPEKADTVLYKCLKCNFCTVSRALLITHQSKHSVRILASLADSPCDSSIPRDKRNDNEKTQYNGNNNERIITQKTEHFNTKNTNTSTSTELFKTKIKVKSNLFNVQQDEDGSLHSLHSFTSLIMNTC